MLSISDPSQATSSNSMDYLASSTPRNRTGRIVIGLFVVAFTFVIVSTIFFAVSTWKAKEPVNLVLFPGPDVATINVNVNGDIEIKNIGQSDVERMVTNPVCSQTNDQDKFDCHPEPDASESRCLKRGCCWKNSEGQTFVKGPAPLDVPSCYYPSDYAGYELSQTIENRNGIMATLRRKTPSGFPKDVQEVRLDVTFLDHNQLRFRLTDANAVRYEVPYPSIKLVAKGRSGQQNYDVTVDQGKLVITRKSSGAKLVEANLNSMIYANQLLQLNVRVPTVSKGFYGLGETQDHLRKGEGWKRMVLFARDRPPSVNLNLYGIHAFYLQMEQDANSHGLFLLNSNILEIITQPTPGITFRPLGGVFDFYVFLGPTPGDVVKQYQDLIGHPIMPPYWSLGFHLCRWGYVTLNKTMEVWQRTKDAGIPFDVQWNDIDYMDHYNDFTYDKTAFAGLPEFVDVLHEEGMRYVMIMDVGVSGAEKKGKYLPFDEGVELDVFVKNSTGDILFGKVWNDVDTVFPDYTHPKANEYFADQYAKFYSEVEFDGAWIDMNEPSNLVDGSLFGCPKDNELEYPPYIPQDIGEGILHVKTICMSARQYATTHYNLHNLHGFTNGIATNYALNKIMPNKRPFIISRSTFAGQGYYTGHWSGDTFSNWDHLRWSITSTLDFAMFGFSMMGTDICGFNQNTTVELCARWQSLGAFYPFSRNHNSNDTIEQDPVALGSVVVSATKKALNIRYRLLPYLYTLFYKATAFGETLFRPLFFEYPKDTNTYSVDNTFLWGAAFMVVPVLEEKSKEAKAYIPDDVWYNYQTFNKIDGVGKEVTFKAELDEINVLVRGGYILPAQEPGLTTTASRKKNFELVVALKDGQAKGDLYWDDGESADAADHHRYNFIEFEAKNNGLTNTHLVKGYDTSMTLQKVDVYGLEKQPKNVLVNGKNVQVNYFPGNKFLKIEGFQASLLEPLKITWI